MDNSKKTWAGSAKPTKGCIHCYLEKIYNQRKLNAGSKNKKKYNKENDNGK